MLVYKSNGGICEAAFVGSLGERAILPTLFATGKQSYLSLPASPLKSCPLSTRVIPSLDSSNTLSRPSATLNQRIPFLRCFPLF